MDVQEWEAKAGPFIFMTMDNHLFELHTGTLETRLKRYTTDNS